MPKAVRLVLLVALLAALVAPATASAKPPKGFVGISADDLYLKDGAYRDKALKAQHAAGVQLIRAAFFWADMQPSPGRIYTGVYDQYVLDAAKHGITFLPILFNAPDWASTKPAVGATRYAYPPRDNALMASWAMALVDRYGPNGSLWAENPSVTARPITSWQIWNEPNLTQYWQPKPNASQYLDMLRTVGAGIKSRDPKAEIVTAGMPDSFQKSAIRLEPYLKALYRGGGSSAFDTLAINSYAVTPNYLVKLMNKTRKLVNGIGGRSDKLWISEVGWCDTGVKHRFCVGKRQAKYTTQALSLIKKKRRAWKLRGFVWFAWRDGRPYVKGKDFWGNHAGLLTIKGKKKPAFKAFTRGVKRF